MSSTFQIAAIIPVSEANGSDSHYTIWFQGCNLKCIGCFNTHTQNKIIRTPRSISSILTEIKNK